MAAKALAWRSFSGAAQAGLISHQARGMGAKAFAPCLTALAGGGAMGGPTNGSAPSHGKNPSIYLLKPPATLGTSPAPKP